MQEKPRIEVPERKVTRIEWDTEADTATIIWSDGTEEEALILELIFGPQGTWSRLAPTQDPTFIICVTQSATMSSETYIVHEIPEIPEQPIVIPPERTEVAETSRQELVIGQETTFM